MMDRLRPSFQQLLQEESPNVSRRLVFSGQPVHQSSATRRFCVHDEIGSDCCGCKHGSRDRFMVKDFRRNKIWDFFIIADSVQEKRWIYRLMINTCWTVAYILLILGSSAFIIHFSLPLLHKPHKNLPWAQLFFFFSFFFILSDSWLNPLITVINIPE